MDRELLLLGLLRRQEMHGYQLHEFIDRDLTVCTDLKKPTAYFLLDKMLTAGWIAEKAEQAGHRPSRRVFAITPEGEAAFQRLLRANLAGWSRAHFPGDIGLAFVDALDPAEAAQLLRHRRDILMAELAAARATPTHAGSLQWLIEHQVQHLAAELDWLDTVLARLDHQAQATIRSQARRPKQQVAAR